MKKYKSLLYRIIPLVLAMALTIALSELFYQNMIDSTAEKCWQELSMARDETANEISNRLDGSLSMMELIADAIVLRTDLENKEAVCLYLDSVQKETIFDRIDVVYPDGSILVSSTGQRVSDQGEKTYGQLLEKGTHISQRVPDFLTGEEAIHVFSVIYNMDNEPIAILGATIYCSTMEKLFTHAYYGETGQIILVDRRDGKLVLDKWHRQPGSIYDMTGYQQDTGGEDFIGAIMAGESGRMDYLSQLNGQTSYTVYAPVAGTDFSLLMIVQENAVFAAVYEMRHTFVWVGIIETVLLLFFSLWIYYNTRKAAQSESRAQKAELELLQQKGAQLQSQYDAAADRREFLETLAVNLPGGYHRCTTDHDFRVTFGSNSFTEVTGYTLEQLEQELGGSYMGIVAPVDREYFLSLAPQLERDGSIHCAYRIRRRDGQIRWVQDSTQYVQREGERYYQCALSDIQDIIRKQEELARHANMMDTLERNMPGGYHRCADAEGWPFLYISDSFLEVTGWSREEIRTEFGDRFINMVLPEDIPLCAGIIEEIQHKGYSNAMYRLKKKGGGHIWVSDSTMRVELEHDTFFHGVLADVSRQVEEMQQAKHLAEASSQAKSTFLFNISHDIRTPMNAIKGFAHIIEENTDDPKLVGEAVAKINQAGDALMMLMNDVLDISRIERGKDEVNLQPMDLYEHGKSLYEMFAADMQAAGIQFRADGDVLNDYVYGDELKLTRIMMNMLSNAKKFTPAGGTVRFGGVRLRRDEKSCTYRFFVRDTGIGMSLEFQKRAFQQFERERTSTESGIVGSGLGLAIIKMLVELMGGTVEIQSQLGEGTEISVTLTLLLADRQRPGQARDQAQGTLDMTGRRVLLVEDNDFNREIARYILESMQFAVEEAQNGAICIEKLLAAAPGYYDLILMDIQMPVMDGYTATIEIRNLADKALAAIPIVAMTANAFEEDKQRCLEVGMNGHIGKPIDMQALMQVCTCVLQ